MQHLGRLTAACDCRGSSCPRRAHQCFRGQLPFRPFSASHPAHRSGTGPAERAQLARPAQAMTITDPEADTNQRIREGDTEAALVQLQVRRTP